MVNQKCQHQEDMEKKKKELKACHLCTFRLYLIELSQGRDEICPLTRRLEVSQRFLDDCRIATITVVILKFQLLRIHDTLV